MSRAQLTSTVEQNTGGAVAPFVAGKNKIINGDFGIWQRGISFSTPANNAYTADRWCIQYNSSPTFTVNQQAFTPGTAPVAGYESTYYLQDQITAGSSSTVHQIVQRMEDVRLFAGQTVTISGWVKSDSSRSFAFYCDQNFGSGGSSTVYNAIISSTFSATTSWQRFTYTATLPSISGKTIGIGSYLLVGIGLSSASTSQTISIWGVQLEAGSVATPFTTASGTLQGELSLCQRYYWRAGGDNSTQTFGVGSGISSTASVFYIQNPVPMRAAPSSTIDYGTLNVTDGVNYGYGCTSVVMTTAGRLGSYITANVASGLTVNRFHYLRSNFTTSDYLGFSAEL